MAIEVVWTILRHENRFLLAQRSTSDFVGGTWVFPGGKIDPEDKTPIDAATRELREEVGIDGEQFRKLHDTQISKYHIQIFCCEQWCGQPKPNCEDIIGVGWFTLAEMHSISQSLSPFLRDLLMFLSYLTQHYDRHPEEWHEKWRKCDESG